MTDPVSQSASPLDAAGRRLERAVIALERQLSGMGPRRIPAEYADPEAATVALALQQAHTRERALAAAAADAARTLGRAAEEIRAVLAVAGDGELENA